MYSFSVNIRRIWKNLRILRFIYSEWFMVAGTHRKLEIEIIWKFSNLFFDLETKQNQSLIQIRLTSNSESESIPVHWKFKAIIYMKCVHNMLFLEIASRLGKYTGIWKDHVIYHYIFIWKLRDKNLLAFSEIYLHR